MKPTGYEQVHGTVNQLGPGRYRARAYVSGRSESLGVHATEAEAWAVIVARHREVLKGGDRYTFANYGRAVLDRREVSGKADVYNTRNRFETHLSTAPFADWPIDQIETPDVARFLQALYRRPSLKGPGVLARRTTQRIMSTMSVVFAEAVRDGLRSSNPCSALRVERTAEELTQENWDWLRPEEQARFLACEKIPLWGRVICRLAWGTGLRQQELYNLELRDVVLEPRPLITVRYGSKGKATKSRKIRRVPLFGEGLAAMRDWLQILSTFAPSNPAGLVFPTENGHRRGKGAPKVQTPDRRKAFLLPVWLKAAGIHRHIRWHDLRHTFGSCLVSGSWGRPRSLEEVRALMGHSTIKTTEIYAHLCEAFVFRAAEETPGSGGSGGGGLVTGLVTAPVFSSLISPDSLTIPPSAPGAIRTRDLRFRNVFHSRGKSTTCADSVKAVTSPEFWALVPVANDA